MHKAVVAIDCRMLNHSGIGNCIKGLLPHVLATQTDTRFILLGKANELSAISWASNANVSIEEFDSPLYSIREQIAWRMRTASHVDLIWVPHINVPYFPTSRLLVTIHDVIFLRMQSLFGPATRFYAKIFYQRIRRRANAIHFVSQFTRNEFYELVGHPTGFSSVIPNGIDESWFHPPKNDLAPQNLPDGPFFVFVGNIKPHKNLRRLISAFKLISQQVPHRLVLVGRKDGFITGDPEIANLTASLCDRIHFTGFVSDETLRTIVSRAAFLTFPSLYEGFGLPPLEALAAGVQVLASRIPPVVETCGSNVTYFDPYDTQDLAEKLLALCASSKVTPCSLNAERFRWPTAASKVTDLINQTLTSNSPRIKLRNRMPH